MYDKRTELSPLPCHVTPSCFLPSLCQVVGLNFSSATTPELLLKTFDHYCEYRRTPNGVVLAPVQLGKWLVLFCDEINLPDMDKYGTQRVISFIRQVYVSLCEHICVRVFQKGI